jgi:hypothetical protein
LSSYGPDLELGQALLDVGRTDAVLDYLIQCKRFWEMDRGALDRWIAQISDGDRPQLKLS